jgi:hypothetical protein
MSLGIEQSQKNRTWTSLLLEESEFSLRTRQAKRKRSLNRFVMSVIVLLFAGILVISSLFYVGAFFDVGKIVGVSQSDRAERAKTKVSTGQLKNDFFSPVTDLLDPSRIYLRAGQSILATYDIPDGAQMTLVIKQCKTKPVIEVFDCDLIAEQKQVIRNRTKGFHRFTVAQPGFYHFKDEVKIRKTAKTADNADYRIVWQRG